MERVSTHDSQGRVFLDRDLDVFGAILKCLCNPSLGLAGGTESLGLAWLLVIAEIDFLGLGAVVQAALAGR